MFGFIKSGMRTHLGGEIFREQKRRRTIILLVVGLIGFVLFNIILYTLTSV
jgi:hypothetical protein